MLQQLDVKKTMKLKRKLKERYNMILKPCFDISLCEAGG
jgi:hypothetical protein